MAIRLKNITCKVCGESFQPKRTWQKFCSQSCRQIGWLMPKRIATSEIRCVYCGLEGDNIDHIPPQVARANIIELGLSDTYPFTEVRCCLECNSALGKRALWTVRERKRFIKKWLSKRYKRVLKIPEWKPEDLLGLGENMRREVVHGLALKRQTEQRLKY